MFVSIFKVFKEIHQRKLESENSHLSASLELRNRQSEVGIDRVDHQRLILQLQNKFRIQIKDIEVKEAKLQHKINEKDEGILPCLYNTKL